MKSWDLQVLDRASTITHVDRENKNGAYSNNKIFYFFLVVIDSVAFCYIQYISKYLETTLHLIWNSCIW